MADLKNMRDSGDYFLSPWAASFLRMVPIRVFVLDTFYHMLNLQHPHLFSNDSLRQPANI